MGQLFVLCPSVPPTGCRPQEWHALCNCAMSSVRNVQVGHATPQLDAASTSCPAHGASSQQAGAQPVHPFLEACVVFLFLVVEWRTCLLLCCCNVRLAVALNPGCGFVAFVP